ncbi:MAG: hypothetical protein CMP34_01860 [Rickettsiales bacterium]|nr:hypothetical protein [Rickettsiales bacterium]
MKFLKKFKFLFFVIIGILIFLWVYEFFAGPQSIEIITKNYDKLYFLILAHILTLCLDSLSWYILAGNKKLSIIWAFLITWISQAAGKFFPTGNITGEFVRAYLGIKRGLNTVQSSSTVFADLVIATYALLIIATFSFFIIISNNLNFFSLENSFFFYASLLFFLVSCLIIFFLVRKRFISFFLKKIPTFFKFSLKKKTVITLIKIDFYLFKLSKEKNKVLKALIFRLIGWLSGAFEIYVFLWIIGIEANYLDLVILESFTSLIKAFAFFIPGGLGIQELAFVMIGDFVGLSGPISFSIAIGRRIREILIGLPAVAVWMILFNRKSQSN